MKQLSIYPGLTYIPVRDKTNPLNDKYNRVAKLAKEGGRLMEKLDRTISKSVESVWGQSALAIKLALMTGMRVGNDDSASGYTTKPHPNEKDRKPEFVQTFGITTLKRTHVEVKGDKVTFCFKGKKSVQQSLMIRDKRLAKQMTLLLAFQIKEKQERIFGVQDHLVRMFVKKQIGSKFLPKDFRTLHANCVASNIILSKVGDKPLTSKKELKKEQRELIETVASKLGNTPGVSKASYIDPMLMDLYTSIRYAS